MREGVPPGERRARIRDVLADIQIEGAHYPAHLAARTGR